MKPVTNIAPPNRAETTSVARGKLRQAADELVGQVFYGTLLRQMRSSTFKGKYGHGGRGEEIFQGQLDEVLATRAGAARSSKISDAIVRRYARRAEVIEAYQQTQRAAQAKLTASAERDPEPEGEVLSW